MPSSRPHLLCLGLGYTAAALAHRLEPRGFAITGTSRSEEGVARLEARGYAGLMLDGRSACAQLEHAVATATHVLVSVPPREDGDPVLALLADALARAPSLGWIGYLSTIGVYGDHAGAWVDEATPPAPGNERSRRRLAAEQAWLTFAARHGRRVEVFRLPGIYGPGRSVIEALRAGTARRIARPGQVFNRMHVADIAAALAAAIERPAVHTVYNLADDEPAPQSDVVAFAARLLGLAPPPLEPFDVARLRMTPMAASFYGESKRVSNARMKAALGVALNYPSYREGLTAIAGGGS